VPPQKALRPNPGIARSVVTSRQAAKNLRPSRASIRNGSGPRSLAQPVADQHTKSRSSVRTTWRSALNIA